MGIRLKSPKSFSCAAYFIKQKLKLQFDLGDDWKQVYTLNGSGGVSLPVQIDKFGGFAKALKGVKGNLSKYFGRQFRNRANEFLGVLDSFGSTSVPSVLHKKSWNIGRTPFLFPRINRTSNDR